jgi:glycosyl transferase, family 25
VNYFDHAIVLNLTSRPDRHAEMSQEMARLGWPENQISWYPAIDPRTSAGFINGGVRGCFLSHLAALNLARNAEYQTVLILEDDCTFSPHFAAMAAIAVADTTWGICYMGHLEKVQAAPGSFVKWPAESGVFLAHCYAVRGPVLPSLCRHLEAMLLRPPGSQDGGPMSPDGALGWFRRSHPEIRTLIASPSVAGQRSSRSDLSPRLLDRIPVVRHAADAFRSWRRRKGPVVRQADGDVFDSGG